MPLCKKASEVLLTVLTLVQLGASEQQIPILGLGLLSWASWQHRSPGHSPFADQQLWVGVRLLAVRHTGPDLDAAVGTPCP